MKAKELKTKTNKELKDMLNARRLELGEIKLNLSSKKIKNIKKISSLKKNIARILTILKQHA